MAEPSPSDLDRPIIVLGAPRSGTTILGQILARHPKVAYLEEPRLMWRYGNDRKSDMLRTDDARPEVCEHIRTVLANHVHEHRAQRLVEKTPSNALRLPFVDRVLPEARYVHILRDGYDSVLSIERFWQDHAGGIPAGKVRSRLKEIQLRRLPHYAKELARRLLPERLAPVVGRRVWGPRLPGIEGLLRDLDVLDVCCLQWRMCVESACHFGRSLPADRYMECRLEEMSPELLKKILGFCELPDSEEVWAYFDETFSATAGHRKASAPPEKLERIARWIEPTMHWLGYGARQEPS